MKDRAPRYYEGDTRAGLVERGSVVMVYPSVPKGKRRYYRAKIVAIRPTNQTENPAVVIELMPRERHKLAIRRSIGGGTSVHVLYNTNRFMPKRTRKDIIKEIIRERGLPQVEITPQE